MRAGTTVASLGTAATALLQQVHDRCSIEHFWHWPRDTQRGEDAHRYRESNGVRSLATLRSLARYALRLDGFWSITEAWRHWPMTPRGFWHGWADENKFRH